MAPYWGWAPRSYIYAVPVGLPNVPAAALETRVRPRKAEVWIDGKLVGQARDFNGTWDRLWLPAGERVIELRRERYKTLRLHVRLAPGESWRIEESLVAGEGLDPRSSGEPRPPRRTGSLSTGFLHIETVPADAAVYLDGEFLAEGEELAKLHGAIPVVVGLHRIEVIRPGFEGRLLEIDVPEGEPVRLRLELERGAGGD
jgi:hypothetical protein